MASDIELLDKLQYSMNLTIPAILCMVEDVLEGYFAEAKPTGVALLWEYEQYATKVEILSDYARRIKKEIQEAYDLAEQERKEKGKEAA